MERAAFAGEAADESISHVQRRVLVASRSSISGKTLCLPALSSGPKARVGNAAYVGISWRGEDDLQG
jgi:hypothetical protein